MSSYEDSSESSSDERDQNGSLLQTFQHQYFLSDSKDIFTQWTTAIIKAKSSSPNSTQQLYAYLQSEVSIILQNKFYRTAYTIRSLGFVFKLNQSFISFEQKIRHLFTLHQEENSQINKQSDNENRIKLVQEYTTQLNQLLKYFIFVIQRNLHHHFEQIEPNFIQGSFQTLEKIFYFIVDPFTLWNLLTVMYSLIRSSNIGPLSISLGGNSTYYKNLLRNLIKKSFQFKEIMERIVGIQDDEKIQKDLNSQILINALLEVEKQSSKLDLKSKNQFAIILKGLYFEKKLLKRKDIYHEYLFQSFHVNHLQVQKKYANFEELEIIFIKLVKESISSQKCLILALNLDFWFLSFQKRKLAPEIQGILMEIIKNYIGYVRSQLQQAKVFLNIHKVNEKDVFPCTKWLFKDDNLSQLIQLLVQIQNGSKTAFSEGSLQVHKIYLEMSKLLREMYLSFGEEEWILPSDILSFLELHFFIRISEDIMPDLKKTLYHMANQLNQQKMPVKVEFKDGVLQRIPVERSEYLKVILLLMDDCSKEEQYINLPEVMPSNKETGILYVKSLQLKLKLHEPNVEQLPYYKLMLQQCEKMKLSINFKWFQINLNATSSDREKEFNIEKQLAEEWMRNIYRKCINSRQTKHFEHLMEKYCSKKSINLKKMAQIMKYCHNFNPFDTMQPNKITNEQQLFDLMEEMNNVLIPIDNIFALNLDEEVGFNYLHVCLGFYNNSIKEAPYNQIYIQILHKIMNPFLSSPKEVVSIFKDKYPAFFNKWIYSFQIVELMTNLKNHIEKREEDASFKQDILYKINIVHGICDNKESIDKNISKESLMECLGEFSSIFHSKMDKDIYLYGVELLSMFLNMFPILRETFSLEFLLTEEMLRNVDFIEHAIEHIKKEYRKLPAYELPNSICLLNRLFLDLPKYMCTIGLKKTFSIIKLYLRVRNQSQDSNISELTDNIMKLNSHQNQGPEHQIVTFLKFLFNIRNNKNSDLADLFKMEEEKDNQSDNSDVVTALKIIYQKIKNNLAKNKEMFQQVRLTDIIFLEEIIEELKDQSTPKGRICREIFKFVLENYGKNEDLIFFANKINMSELVCFGPKRQEIKSEKEQNLLIDLIIQNSNKQIQTELIKQLLRQNKMLSQVASKAIQKMTKQNRKVHPYHINRLIQINSRYPNQKIEQFLIQHLADQRNTSDAKINQKYLIVELSKKLQKVPTNLCEEMLLKPTSESVSEKIQNLINEIFEKMLYLPVNKFDKVNMQVIEEKVEEEQEGWKTESEGEKSDEQTEVREAQKMMGKSKDAKDNEKKQQEVDLEQPQDQQQILSQEGSMLQQPIEDQQYNDDYSSDRPQFLEVFTEESRKEQLQIYEQLMYHRELLDIYIGGAYQQLLQGNDLLADQNVIDKILEINKILQKVQTSFKEQIILHMPRQLYQVLRIYGLDYKISEEEEAKFKKKRQAVKSKPKFIEQFFSDREESDDSNASQADEDDEDDEDDSAIYDARDDEGNDEREYSDEEDNQKKKKKSHRKNKDEDVLEPPELLPTYSKIQEEIAGNQLTKSEIIKILEIAVYQLLVLPQNQIKTRHVTSFYLNILESKFSQMFLESAITIIRLEEGTRNLQQFLKQLKTEKSNSLDIGLEFISLENAVENIVYLLKEHENHINEVGTKKVQNILLKESGSLLPIANEVISKFDLPIQNNCISLLFIYISTKKRILRENIRSLNYERFYNDEDENDEKQNNKQAEYVLKSSELNRLIEKICKHKCSNKIWQMVEDVMNIKIKPLNKLFTCLKGYGQNAFMKLYSTGLKIFRTFENSEQVIIQELNEQRSHLHSLQNTYHVVSKLLQSCKDQIKQFYFVNKEILRQLFNQEEENFDDQAEIKKIPKLLISNQHKILTHPDLIKLTELMFFFIKHLTDKFYGKVQDKIFSKLIHYPKMIIEASWTYIAIFNRKTKYLWKMPTQIDHFFKNNKIGQYKFQNLQEVCNLILHFLHLESFCSDKFKDILIPAFMENISIGRQIPLIFKTPKIDDESHDQNVLVTRNCSFDMTFYQLKTPTLYVQFYGEEGNDHGGLVRELMMGWKGKGVGEEGFFIGKILAISFNQGVPYGGVMDIAMFMAITDYQLSVSNIQFFQDFDPEIYRSLVFIRDNDPECLSLNFAIEKDIFGKIVEFQLIPNGKNIDLVEGNKTEYLNNYMKKYFFFGRERELEELRVGFYTIVHPSYAKIFTPFEMLRQIRGEEIVDKKILKSKAKYEEGYSEESAVIKWLWELIEQFNQEQMNKFIQFVTGSPKISVYNSNFQICIEKVYDIESLPVAHTCFNTLDLPEYGSKEVLQKKLLTAIMEGNDNFGIA